MQKELLTLILACSLSANAAEQSLDVLKEFAVAHLQSQLPVTDVGEWEITAGYLDPRLQLTACPTALLKAYLPSGTQPQQASTVGIRCDNATPWSLFVPVSVHLFADVITAKHPLQKGIPLTEQDINVTREDISHFSQGYFRTPQQVLGYEVKHPVMPGHVLSPTDIVTSIAIHKGDAVNITASIGGVTVAMGGVAQSQGAIGEHIPVKNTQSQRIVQAEVVDSHHVKTLSN